MAGRPFVDTHVHYWDLKDPTLQLRVARAATGSIPVLGNIDGLKVLAYMAAGVHRRDAVPERLEGDPRPGGDRDRGPGRGDAWLQEQADATGFPHGIVAHCDLAAPNAQEVIERHLEYANFRGVRDFGQGDYLVDPDWQRGYGLLARHGLVFCIDPIVGDDGQGARRSPRRTGRHPLHRPRRLPARAHRRVLRQLAQRHGDAWRARRT